MLFAAHGRTSMHVPYEALVQKKKDYMAGGEHLHPIISGCIGRRKYEWRDNVASPMQSLSRVKEIQPTRRLGGSLLSVVLPLYRLCEPATRKRTFDIRGIILLHILPQIHCLHLLARGATGQTVQFHTMRLSLK